jgi:hypothetical protein
MFETQRFSGFPPICTLIYFSFRWKRKLVARKRGRCAQKAPAGKEIHLKARAVFPQNAAGLSGARPGAPTTEKLSSWKKNGLPARPRK